MVQVTATISTPLERAMKKVTKVKGPKGKAVVVTPMGKKGVNPFAAAMKKKK